MPTSYTNTLDENPDLTTAEWVTKELVLAFGVCISLRDYRKSLTEDEIEIYLEEEITRTTKLYRQKLVDAQEELEELDNKPETWDELYSSSAKETEKGNAQSIEEARVKQVCYKLVREQLIKLRDNTKDETTRNIAEYGLNQLKIVENETEPMITSVPSIEHFQMRTLRSLRWDVEYYTEKIKKTEELQKQKLSEYQTVRSEVKEILGGGTK